MSARHRFHGDPRRFEAIAMLVRERFGVHIRNVADVAGGQGMLSRMLIKRLNMCAEVIDPRGWTLKGVPSLQQHYDHAMAPYYDLIIGLHPDEALLEVVHSAAVTRTIVVPCCNFWSRSERLGRDALLCSIGEFYRQRGVEFERVLFQFAGPYNVGFVTTPPVRMRKPMPR